MEPDPDDPTVSPIDDEDHGHNPGDDPTDAELANVDAWIKARGRILLLPIDEQLAANQAMLDELHATREQQQP